MSIFEQAAKLNNRGIISLIEGRDSHAIDTMTESIKLMKQELRKDGAQMKDFKAALSGQCSDLSTVEIPDMDTDDQYAAFNHAIHISYESSEPRFDIQMYSAAVIFNLALAHHRLVMQGDKSLVEKTVKLYSLVLKLLENWECHKGIAIIKLAAINNLAQMRFANGEYEHAREGLDHLSAFMRKANNALLDEPEVQGLLMNVLLLKAPKVAPAA